MTEAKNIKQVVSILKRVPPKKLLIVELLNQIPVKHGELDTDMLAKLGSEIEDAKVEAEAYCKANSQARLHLEEMR
jgi:hypothetical protein